MAKLKLNAKTIKPYLDNIEIWNCNVPWFWDKLSAEEKAECFNGVGSDLTPIYIRNGLTLVFDFAIEAVIIHDVIWSYKEKYKLNERDFKESNRNLKINSRICLRNKYSKWNQPYYSWCYAKGWLAEDACNRFGKDAWDN